MAAYRSATRERRTSKNCGDYPNKLSCSDAACGGRKCSVVVLHAGGVEAEPLAGDLEAAADHPGDRARAGHALAEGRIVILAAAHVADELEDVAIAVGKIRHQPFAEQVAHFQRQAQQHIAGMAHAGLRHRLEDALDLGIVDRRNDRRHHGRGRHAGLDQLPQRFEPARRRRGARLHGARELGIERRHRDRHLDQIALGHARQDVEIAQHQRRFGDDADRMAGALQHFEDAAHDLVAPLDRLIRIGIGADGDDLRHVARRRQFALQQFRRVRLHEQLRFEIEPRRQPEIGVGRPRETIDAAVLAAAIGIDRAIEGNVRRIVAGDDLAGGVDRHAGLERRQFLELLPAVVEGDARQRLVTPGRVRMRAAAAAALAVDGGSRLARRRGGQRRRRAFQCGRSAHGLRLLVQS